MAVRSNEPRQGTAAALTAGLVMLAWLAAPVLAAPDRNLLCAENAAPEFDVPATELTATPVNNSDELLEDHLLRPNSESAARSAFAEEESDVVEAKEKSEDKGDALTTESLRPSAADRQLSPYKRQMYRRDI